MRKHITTAAASVLVALFATGSSAKDHHNSHHNQDVSRAGKNVTFVLQVSSSGASTPQSHFYQAKNATEEPKILDFSTPLGQRQQYLIGSELRKRYVDEATDFLSKSYDISSMWIQSTFDQKSILSAQAQLIGLYPPSSNNNFINEVQ